jgi:hypothetical protein
MRKSLLFLFSILICCGQPSDKELIVPKRIDYSALKTQIKNTQKQFNKGYATADTNGKDSIRKAARQYVFETITSHLFGQWYGTPWAFYGHTKEPRQGEIACGYFVNTILSDAGFNIPGDDWAQLASETFIVKLTSDLKRSSNKPISETQKYVANRGDGLYLVGLDKHVGFIYVKGETVKFVHSNYYQREIGVMAEDLDTKNPLRDSKYRVLGKLLDDKMMENWITGKAYQ